MNCCWWLISLGLFFGLFFGLNYPEIVRHGWPRASCTILSSQAASYYCCQANCETKNCPNAPSSSPSCGPVLTQLNSGYSPSACALNSSACPPDIGSVCDGGSFCCLQCQRGPQDGLSCCISASNIRCTVSCPICYDVNLSVSYKTIFGQLENANYTQDFGTDNNTASAFYTQHLVNSTSACHYNPHHLSQVLLNASFTTWKWIITAIFGFLPLSIVLFLALRDVIIWGLNEGGYTTSIHGWYKNRITNKTIPAGELVEKNYS